MTCNVLLIYILHTYYTMHITTPAGFHNDSKIKFLTSSKPTGPSTVLKAPWPPASSGMTLTGLSQCRPPGPQPPLARPSPASLSAGTPCGPEVPQPLSMLFRDPSSITRTWFPVQSSQYIILSVQPLDHSFESV